MSHKVLVVTLLLALAFGATVMMVQAQSPDLQHGFTYQGQLKNGGAPVNGTCDLQMGLWNALTAGVQIGGTQTVTANVTNGLFTVTLNESNQFGANPFDGSARWLASSVRCPAGSGTYTALSPRQPLGPAPYALFASAPWTTSGSQLTYMNGNVGIGVTNPSSRLEIGAQDGLAIDGYQPYLTLRDSNSGNKRGVIQSAGGSLYLIPDSFIGVSAPVAIGNNGHVGMGFTPEANTQLTIMSAGTTNNTYGLRVHNGNGNPSLWVLDDGQVWIKSAGTAGSTYGLWVRNGNGDDTLVVRDDGTVRIGYIGGTNYNRHICANTPSGAATLVNCGSASEYVPTIDRGFGYPETADLVSIAPNIANPYGDDHSPFVVAQSTQACDDNLLGYITSPEKGADGTKKNDSYLPLAIFGYFPAKVTTSNGVIKRGDALTSSAKAGYAMKATGPCKIIGYALEDAPADGTIQVFANLSENTAPQVAALQKENADLRAQNAQLETRVADLEQTSAALQTRLSTLEQTAQLNAAPARPESTGSVALLVIAGLAGIVLIQKPWQRGER